MVQTGSLGGNIGVATRQLLEGDKAGALKTLASVLGVLELNVDLSAGAGVEVEFDIGQVTVSAGAEMSIGTEATFNVDAQDGLIGDIGSVAKNFLNGDIQQDLATIGNIEGDLSVQSHRETSREVGIEVDTRVVDVSVTGTATDKDEELSAEGVTLRDGILIATNEAGEFAADEIAPA